MGFPYPAADYTEERLSLDRICNTGDLGVYLIRSETHSFREGIRLGALVKESFFTG